MGKKLLCLAPVVLLALLKIGVDGLCTSAGECPSYKPACIDNACVDPCINACGVNADCNLVNRKSGSIPVCSCPKNMTGDPFRYCRPFEVCTSDGECPSHKPACIDHACVDPCINACGVNADCNLVNRNPVCSCPKNMTGDPFTYCRPFEVRLCTSDGECPSYKPACIANACVDPCINACGVNADCNLVNRKSGSIPVCSCPKNMTGDPFRYCRPFEVCGLCEPNPCGENAKCTLDHDRTVPVCTCPVGYIGNALVSCEKGECELDSQCPDHLACVGYQCVDPCLGNTQCGSDAVCNARGHLAVCTCPNGRNGDARVNCYKAPASEATTSEATTPEAKVQSATLVAAEEKKE